MDWKQLENVAYFYYLGSVKCTLEIKYRIVTAKAAVNRKKVLPALWT
jgi:hypothetical protein